MPRSLRYDEPYLLDERAASPIRHSGIRWGIGLVRFREGFRMPARRERSTQVRGRASESPRRRNPRESDERLAVYGDLARQEVWQEMVFAGSLRAESR
jgi:hypothetical protein